MVHHYWGEEGFDWQGLDDAISFLYEYCAKWGRFSGQAKEKYGRACLYAQFGFSIHSLIFPKSCYFKHPKFPQWLWNLDCDLHLNFYPLINKAWIPYQYWIYSRAYLLAIKKWPHLRAEILCGADSPEMIKGICKQRQDENGEWHLDILGENGEVLGGWMSRTKWKVVK